MKESGSEGGESRPEEVAAYIAAMTAEMGRLARKHNLMALGYLLDLARMEAEEQVGAEAPDDGQRIA
jgi:hypothetical protein